MGEVYFYHLTARPLEATLPMLLEKSLEQGWRVVVRGADEARLDWLDERLWLGADDGFLPHGRAGGEHDARQPILLTTALQDVGDCLICIDRAPISAPEVSQVERACVLFDGGDQEALHLARGQWKDLTQAGCPAQYWAEDQGRWQMKARSEA